MPLMLDPFITENSFEMGSLTAAINLLPNNYGRLREMNLFPADYVPTRTVFIEEQNGVLSLLKTQPVGGPAQKAERGKRALRSFKVPHIPYDDFITIDDVEGIRNFGSETQVMMLNDLINKRLQEMKNNHAITLEYLRIGALKGIIYDADATELFNLYTEFLIKPKSVDFVFGTATTNIKAKCMTVKRHIETNLKGETMQGDPHVLVDAPFFDALTNHPTVVEKYNNWADAAVLRGDVRKGFPYGGLVFEEYEGTSSYHGTTRKFFSSTYGTGIAFPMGTMNTFKTVFAPPTFLSTVNMPYNQPIFAKAIRNLEDTQVQLITQSNPLPLCMRPGCLVTVTSST